MLPSAVDLDSQVAVRTIELASHVLLFHVEMSPLANGLNMPCRFR